MPETSTDFARDTAAGSRQPVSARRRSGFRRSGRGLVIGLVGLVVAGLVGAGAEAVISRSDDERYPPPGRLVTVAGKDLHLNCTGTGAPTVVLEAGLGEPSLTWADVQSSLDDGLRVCSYDRAGLGWSGGGDDGAWTAEQAAADLAGLLSAAGESGPYVLVAHSVGALVSREFRQAHPEEVAAMVLLDPTDDEAVRTGGVPTVAVVERRIQGLLARTGVLRWLGEWLVPAVVGDQPPEALLRQLPAAYHPGSIDASLRELRGTVPSAEHLQGYEDPSWADLPVTVISAESATAAQRDSDIALTARSSQGRHVSAESGGHYVHYADPLFVVGLVRDAATAAD
jgi:pimeloyl-ACP methyl ester carboxylesterase